MSNSEFTKAKQVADPNDQKTVRGVEDTGSPVETHAPDLVATYESDMGSPYVAKYFDIENTWNSEEAMARDIKEIEGYIREQVSKGNLDNSIKATEKFLKELERKAGLTTYESTNNRIDKLLAYIDFKRVVNGDKQP